MGPGIPTGYCILELSSALLLLRPRLRHPLLDLVVRVVSNEGARAGLTYQVAAFLNMTWVIMSAAGAPAPASISMRTKATSAGSVVAAPSRSK